MIKLITEMLIEKDKLFNKLYDKVDIMLIHLVKCFAYKNSTNDLKHWEKEIYSFLNRVPKLRTNKKWPSYKLLKSILVDIIEDSVYETIDNFIKTLIHEGYPKIKEYDKKEISNDIIEYLDWLSLELSKNGSVSLEDIENKIDNLID